MATAESRKNGVLGYKAIVRYPDGGTYQPTPENFPTREAACSRAQAYLDEKPERHSWTSRAA